MRPVFGAEKVNAAGGVGLRPLLRVESPLFEFLRLLIYLLS